MTTLDLSNLVRENRGSFRNEYKLYTQCEKIVDTPLEEQAWKNKRLGMARLSEICETHSHEELSEIAIWMENNPTANKAAVELHLTKY